MDEKGRNGRKWHLAQQLAHHVTMHILSLAMFKQQFTQPVTPYLSLLQIIQHILFSQFS